MLNDVHSIVVMVRNCSSLSEELERLQSISGKVQPLKLILDVKTRWNSTYYMLKRFDELGMYVTQLEESFDFPDEEEMNQIRIIINLQRNFILHLLKQVHKVQAHVL